MMEDIIEPLTLAEAMNEPVDIFSSISSATYFSLSSLEGVFLCKSLGVMVGGSALDTFFSFFVIFFVKNFAI